MTTEMRELSTIRKHGKKVIPGLGMAAASLLLVGTASASTGAADMTAQQPREQIVLSEEEVPDVSLATFHVFDRENHAPKPGVRVAGFGCRR